MNLFFITQTGIVNAAMRECIVFLINELSASVYVCYAFPNVYTQLQHIDEWFNL